MKIHYHPDPEYKKANDRLKELSAVEGHQVVVFAGGCFWCIEAAFTDMEGVLGTVSGYMGGDSPNPSYRLVSGGQSGYREVVAVFYDPQKVSYRALLDRFWLQIDPTDAGGQFADRGHQYTTAIYTTTDEQQQQAMKAKQELNESDRYQQPIVTEILSATDFYPAENYHQEYSGKNPRAYQQYAVGSGRKPYIERMKKKIAQGSAE